MRFLPRENRAQGAEGDAGFFEPGADFVVTVQPCCPMRYVDPTASPLPKGARFQSQFYRLVHEAQAAGAKVATPTTKAPGS